jgi:hypothetical protein
MEPISAIVTALALGAVAALKEVSAQAVKDAYAGLKNLIQQKYSRVSITQLEDAPDSKVQREAVQEAFKKAGAEHDEELLRKVKELMDAVQTHAPATAAAIGVDIEDIKAASVRIANIIAERGASGVKARHLDVSGPVVIEGVYVGEARAEPTKKPQGQ